MYKLTSENRGTVRSPSSTEHSKLESDAPEKERSDSMQKKSSAIRTIISKNLAEKWISKIEMARLCSSTQEFSLRLYPDLDTMRKLENL